jgi:amino acid adenylation domain-containing protein
MGVLLRELAALYEACSTGKPSSLPELPIQYADFAVWQREWLRGEVLEAQLAHWKRQLGESPPVLELPTDHPRPATRTFRGARQSVVLPKHVSEGLKVLSRHEGVTLYMALLAAFKTLLHRYTGQEDFALGSPVAGRNRSEFEGLIGFFVNTLVLRADLSGNPTFRELLERTRKVALDAYAHQDMPFEKLVEEIQPERDLSHHPLFQVMFILQNTPGQTLELPGLAVSDLEVDNGTAKFDLTLSMVEGAEGLKGTFEINTDLFDEATVTRMAGHFRVLLEGIVADPDQRLSGLPLLTEVERHQLLVEWNETQADYPEDKCIHELFEAQAEQTPEAIAVVFDEEQLTYQELNRRANQLAHHLQGLGVGPEVLVGICMQRSSEMVVGLLAILKAGGAYLPLDPGYPQERLVFMLEDAQVSALLTSSQLSQVLPEHGAHLVCLDVEWEQIGRQNKLPVQSGATARDLAYVLFTSGSTGQPKGIAIEHRSAVALIHWAREVFGSQDLDGVLASTSISWDLSVFELFVTLSWGGMVILAENALQLADLPAAGEVKLINSVPSAAAQLLRSGGIPDSVRTVNLAGEPLSAALVDQLYAARASIERVFDLYGPGEDTTYSTFALRRQAGPEIIGRPISNTQVYLLDANLEPVPIGVPGELYLGGAGLARGYLNRPELTAQQFIPNPFGDQPGTRLYKTGDLARYQADGNLEFLGRKDHQVKIRGFRIELGEIEATLSQHPGVRQNVIIAREDTPNEKRLVAYVVPNEGQSLTVGNLRTFLRAKLPEYMVPSLFVTLEALPLTPNGKVNRQALPAPDVARPELETTYVTARNLVEEVLTEIWIETLGLEQVGIHDNFFELGGHSLLATQIISRIHRYFRVEIPLRSLFEAPTVAGLAKTLVEYEIVPGQVATTARLIKDIDEMSADRIRAILREKKKARTEG